MKSQGHTRGRPKTNRTKKFMFMCLFLACKVSGLSSLQKCVVKFLVKFDLQFEISDGKNLVKFGGRTFLPARKAQEISGRISGRISEQISEKISETSFQISRLLSETSFSRRAVLTKCPFQAALQLPLTRKLKRN